MRRRQLLAATTAMPVVLAGGAPSVGAARTIVWSGQTWTIKESHGRAVGPGGNRFSSGSRQVMVEPDGALRLRIGREGQHWACAEVVAGEPGEFGYGTYHWVMESPAEAVRRWAILGLFTWDDTSSEQANREIDVEIGRWRGDASGMNGLFTVQPYTVPGASEGFALTNEAMPTSVGFVWRAGSVEFIAARGVSLTPIDPGDVIATWTTTMGVPTPGMEQPRINFWLQGHRDPLPARAMTVRLRSFTFTPEA